MPDVFVFEEVQNCEMLSRLAKKLNGANCLLDCNTAKVNCNARPRSRVQVLSYSWHGHVHVSERGHAYEGNNVWQLPQCAFDLAMAG